jgi:AhpD family alkylhydroperoxidase
MTDSAITDPFVELRARMPHPAFLLEGGMDALSALSAAASAGGIATPLAHLISLRASQINSCSWCTVEHTREMRQEDGATDEKIAAVAAWRDAPYFSATERAVLELTEAVTRLADRADPVSDRLWAELTELFSTRQIASLLFSISAINAWNRINAAIRQPAGQR